MYNRDRSPERPGLVIPNGCQNLAKELETLQWVSGALAHLHRVSPCVRKDALVKSLTEMLEKSDYRDPIETLRRLNHAETEIKDLESVVKSLKGKLKEDNDEVMSSLLDKLGAPTEIAREALPGYKILSQRVVTILVSGTMIAVGMVVYLLIKFVS